MQRLIFVFVLAMLLTAIFGIIAFVKRIRKKTYKIPWTICRLCFAGGIASLIVATADRQWKLMLFFVAMLLAAYGVCQAVAFGIRKLTKKPAGHSLRKMWISIGGSILMVILSVGGNLTSTLNLFAIVFFFAAAVLLLVSLGMTIAKRKNKRLWLTVPVCMAAGILLMIAADYCWDRQLKARTAAGEIYETPVQITYDFEVVDGDAPIEIVPSKTIDLFGGSSVSVFEESDLNLSLEKTYATAQECIDAIQANNKIAPKFKDFFCDFVRRIDRTYPDMNLAILYQNLATLDIQELGSTEYLLESLSMDSLGCYNKCKNTIFIPEGTVYVEGEFGFQVLLHEFCHVVRSSQYEVGESKYKIDFYDDSDNLLLMEAMNSVFSCSLLNYYEWDIAYQVASNYLRIMLECMDNYSLEDYVEHRDTYFLRKLDEVTGRTNYAQVIWKLIALQRSDWEDDDIDIPAEEYYPIFDYLCELYYGKYISEDMTAEEKKAVADELVYKAFYDAPENYKIAPDYFYEYLGLGTSF